MLQIQKISKKYVVGDMIQTALDEVVLNLRDNEFVAILGPSGSGKTTLLVSTYYFRCFKNRKKKACYRGIKKSRSWKSY